MEVPVRLPLQRRVAASMRRLRKSRQLRSKKAEPIAPPTPTCRVVTAKVPASGLSHELVARSVLEVVAEKTGYPAEMLNLEMGLDSDLGVDSIKRVEIMAAFAWSFCRKRAGDQASEHLGTLQDVESGGKEFLTCGNEGNCREKAQKREPNLFCRK